MNQSFLDFELIVINDGSTDSTLDILAGISDARLKVFSYPNLGLSASRNRGIKLASGDLVSFLDADDLWTPEKLESQIEALRVSPDAALAYSWTDFIDEHGNLLGYGIHQTAYGYVFPSLLELFFIGSGSNALIRKYVFYEVGMFDETLASAEDWDMFLRIAAQYHVACVPASQVLYRITENSMSRNVVRQERESIKVIERAYSQEPGSSFLRRKKYTYANLYIYLASNALRGNPDREKGILATRFLWYAVKNDPIKLKQATFFLTLIFKIVTAIIFPPQQAKLIRKKIKSIIKRD